METVVIFWMRKFLKAVVGCRVENHMKIKSTNFIYLLGIVGDKGIDCIVTTQGLYSLIPYKSLSVKVHRQSKSLEVEPHHA